MITVTPEAKEKIAEMCVENAMIGVGHLYTAPAVLVWHIV